MKGAFLLKKRLSRGPKANIFAKRSALLLHDLLLQPEDDFSVQALARDTGLSVGLVHRVVSELVHDGFVRAGGLRTAKKYRLSKRGALFRKWLETYDITERSRFYTYNTAYSASEIEQKLLASRLLSSTVLALHSACRRLGYSFTNLEKTELYLLKPENRGRLERLLQLEPCDRGYDVLLIEPYYSQIVAGRSEKKEGLLVSPPLLTVLDLYHFPLRGEEQAEHMFRRHPALKQLSHTLKKK